MTIPNIVVSDVTGINGNNDTTEFSYPYPKDNGEVNNFRLTDIQKWLSGFENYGGAAGSTASTVLNGIDNISSFIDSLGSDNEQKKQGINTIGTLSPNLFNREEKSTNTIVNPLVKSITPEAPITNVNPAESLLNLTNEDFSLTGGNEYGPSFNFGGIAKSGPSTEGPGFFDDFLKKGGGLDMINGSLNTLTGLYGASLAKKQLDLSKDAMRENMALNRANYENSAKSYNNQLAARNASMRGSTARLEAADNSQLLSQDYRRG